jgi:hypothetical protein
MTAPQAAKKETGIITMKDVIFMYTSVSREVAQLNTDNKPPLSASTSPTFGLEFHSFEVKILVSEKRYKKLKKDFTGAKNLPNAKEHEKDELLEKYDFLNESDLDDDMVLIKFSQSCLVGKPDTNGVRKSSFPIKQIGIKGKVQDINGLEVTQETSIGNGSKGHFQFRPVEGKNGLYLYPQLVCITELTEYAGGTGEEDLDSLGLEDLDEADMEAEADKLVEDQAPEKEAAKEEAPKKEASDDVASDDEVMF